MRQKSLKDDAKTGRKVQVLTNENIAFVKDLVLDHQRLMVKEVV